MALPPGISAPRYNLAAVTQGIVHIGLGGFHRAHFARYTHDAMEVDPGALGWGIVGAGLRVNDVPLLTALDRQDGLYTLVERDARTETRTLIGSIVGTVDASAFSAALLATIARPTTRIVSITVSEHGYHLDGPTKALDFSSVAIRHDLATPHTPRTMPGILVEAYRRRRQASQSGFTALSCDNIPHNGNVLRAAVLAMAEGSNPALAAWIAEHGRFPNSMVDRITPIPTQEQITTFAAETGIADAATVFAESFRQWVIEDDFAAGRPDWDRVGAQFVSDVSPYESMKLRLLNASHLAIAGLGALSGYETIGETIADPLIQRYMIRLMDEETGPTLAPVPGIDLAAYKATLIDRFNNPAIRDTTARVNADAPVNLLLDPLRDRLAAGASIKLLSLALSAWCRRMHDNAERHLPDFPEDPSTALLDERTRGNLKSPTDILSIEAIFGELSRSTTLKKEVGTWLASITRHGIAVTLERAGERGCF